MFSFFHLKTQHVSFICLVSSVVLNMVFSYSGKCSHINGALNNYIYVNIYMCILSDKYRVYKRINYFFIWKVWCAHTHIHLLFNKTCKLKCCTYSCDIFTCLAHWCLERKVPSRKKKGIRQTFCLPHSVWANQINKTGCGMWKQCFHQETPSVPFFALLCMRTCCSGLINLLPLQHLRCSFQRHKFTAASFVHHKYNHTTASFSSKDRAWFGHTATG